MHWNPPLGIPHTWALCHRELSTHAFKYMHMLECKAGQRFSPDTSVAVMQTVGCGATATVTIFSISSTAEQKTPFKTPRRMGFYNLSLIIMLQNAPSHPVSATSAFEKCYTFKIATGAFWSYKYCNSGLENYAVRLFIFLGRIVDRFFAFDSCVGFTEETIICKQEKELFSTSTG